MHAERVTSHSGISASNTTEASRPTSAGIGQTQNKLESAKTESSSCCGWLSSCCNSIGEVFKFILYFPFRLCNWICGRKNLHDLIVTDPKAAAKAVYYNLSLMQEMQRTTPELLYKHNKEKYAPQYEIFERELDALDKTNGLKKKEFEKLSDALGKEQAEQILNLVKTDPKAAAVYAVDYPLGMEALVIEYDKKEEYFVEDFPKVGPQFKEALINFTNENEARSARLRELISLDGLNAFFHNPNGGNN